MLAATVIVPTYNHGPTLLRSVPTALNQTVRDLEVVIIGDGVPDSTREIVASLQADSRVRFIDHPKGPRHGEAYRAAALAEANGEIVCYLADDDLWLPTHVATMRELLADADFAHALPITIHPGDVPVALTVDLALEADRALLLGGQNRVPFSCGAHTLDLYRRLPDGWRTTPDGIPTDLYMWQQILSLPGCRAVSGTRPTVLTFPSPLRRSDSPEERCAELDRYVDRLGDPSLIAEVYDGVLRDQARLFAEMRTTIDELREAYRRATEGVEARDATIHELERSLARETARAKHAEDDIETRDTSISELQRELAGESARAERATADVLARDERIRALQWRLDGLTADLRSFTEELAGHNRRLDQLSRRPSRPSDARSE